MNIKLYINKEEVPYETFVFNGGEIQIKLPAKPFPEYIFFKSIQIVARLVNSEEIFRLALLKDAIERTYGEYSIDLIMPYIPYARQDRICDAGESFTLKVFTEYLNLLCFDSVTVFDPHSDVSAALIDNVIIFDQTKIIERFDEFFTEIYREDKYTLVSPDAGANKKTAKLAGWLGHEEFIRADKRRDLSNGQIIETIVHCDDLKGRTAVIVDDLSEYGGTFIALAKELKQRNCGGVILYVTHGIFPVGTDKLFENGIDEIYTTNSFRGNYEDRVNVLEIEQFFVL